MVDQALNWLQVLAFVQLAFTAPADSVTLAQVKAYGVQTIDRYGHQAVVACYSRPAQSSGPPIPARPGKDDSLFVWESEDWQGRLYVVFSKDRAGNVSRPSNPVMVACGQTVSGADTVFFNVASSGAQPKWSHATVSPRIRLVAWPLRPYDFRMESENPALKGLGPVLHQETLQRAAVTDLCRAFGFWCLRGDTLKCP